MKCKTKLSHSLKTSNRGRMIELKKLNEAKHCEPTNDKYNNQQDNGNVLSRKKTLRSLTFVSTY